MRNIEKLLMFNILQLSAINAKLDRLAIVTDCKNGTISEIDARTKLEEIEKNSKTIEEMITEYIKTIEIFTERKEE